MASCGFEANFAKEEINPQPIFMNCKPIRWSEKETDSEVAS